MSQQPRRRRRRRRGRGSGGQSPQGQGNDEATHQSSGAEHSQQPKSEGSRRGRRRRGRGRSRGGGERSFTPAKSSEDIVRAPRRTRPETLTLPPDERRLEDIIGSLQSEMGVPQNPQEYRLTIKIAEERDSGTRPGRPSETKSDDGGGNGKPKREKAPSAPRVGGDDSERVEASPSRRRRSRRRRRGGRGRGPGSRKPNSN